MTVISASTSISPKTETPPSTPPPSTQEEKPAPVVADLPTRTAATLVASGGKTKPTDPATALREPVAATHVKSRRSTAKTQASGTSGAKAIEARLPSEKDAKAAISKLLPKIAEAVSLARDGEKGINNATCDTAAGLALAALRQRGFVARLSDANGHITLRVQTAGNELIVDPTLSQFFVDGSATDSALRDSGGFVGTEQELRTLIKDQVADWEYIGGDPDDGLADPSIDDATRNRTLDENIEQMVMSRLFKRQPPSGLAANARLIARRFDAYIRGNDRAASSDNQRAAFELLRSK